MRYNRSIGICVLACATMAGCNDAHDKSRDTSRMFASSKDFNRGRADGKRDAKWSMLDDNAAWLWLWMTKDGYEQGYDHGWREGRAEVKFQKEQKQARRDTKSDKSEKHEKIEKPQKAPKEE